MHYVVAFSLLKLLFIEYIWLGGGEYDLKLGLNINQFIKKLNVFVADVVDDNSNDK